MYSAFHVKISEVLTHIYKMVGLIQFSFLGDLVCTIEDGERTCMSEEPSPEHYHTNLERAPPEERFGSHLFPKCG